MPWDHIPASLFEDDHAGPHSLHVGEKGLLTHEFVKHNDFSSFGSDVHPVEKHTSFLFGPPSIQSSSSNSVAVRTCHRTSFASHSPASGHSYAPISPSPCKAVSKAMAISPAGSGRKGAGSGSMSTAFLPPTCEAPRMMGPPKKADPHDHTSFYPHYMMWKMGMKPPCVKRPPPPGTAPHGAMPQPGNPKDCPQPASPPPPPKPPPALTVERYYTDHELGWDKAKTPDLHFEVSYASPDIDLPRTGFDLFSKKWVRCQSELVDRKQMAAEWGPFGRSLERQYYVGSKMKAPLHPIIIMNQFAHPNLDNPGKKDKNFRAHVRLTDTDTGQLQWDAVYYLGEDLQQGKLAIGQVKKGPMFGKVSELLGLPHAGQQRNFITFCIPPADREHHYDMRIWLIRGRMDLSTPEENFWGRLQFKARVDTQEEFYNRNKQLLAKMTTPPEPAPEESEMEATSGTTQPDDPSKGSKTELDSPGGAG